jgi:hypothetical protein
MRFPVEMRAMATNLQRPSSFVSEFDTRDASENHTHAKAILEMRVAAKNMQGPLFLFQLEKSIC